MMVSPELQPYMDRAKQFALLTREDEVALSRVFIAGLQAEQTLKEGPVASDEEKKSLTQIMAAGRKARDTFLNANLRLVVSLASKMRWSGLGVQDLVQEGNIGMMKALSKWDPDRGFKFSTYASWWIKQAMARATQNSDMIRLPVYKVDVRNRVRRGEGGFTGNPSDEAVATAIGMTAKEVSVARNLPYVGVSLDEPIGEDESGSLLIDTLRDDDTEDAESAAILGDTGDKIVELFEGVPERTRIVFEMRYGDSCASLEDIGQVIGCTRERVRQILLVEGRALKRRAQVMGIRG